MTASTGGHGARRRCRLLPGAWVHKGSEDAGAKKMVNNEISGSGEDAARKGARHLIYWQAVGLR